MNLRILLKKILTGIKLPPQFIHEHNLILSISLLIVFVNQFSVISCNYT